MPVQRYDIIMRTPLGLREGTMLVQWVGKLLSGTVSLLQHTEPFHGVIDEDGLCRITGRLVTLLRSIQYQATGWIDRERVRLSLHGAGSVFELSGAARREERP